MYAAGILIQYSNYLRQKRNAVILCMLQVVSVNIRITSDKRETRLYSVCFRYSHIIFEIPSTKRETRLHYICFRYSSAMLYLVLSINT